MAKGRPSIQFDPLIAEKVQGLAQYGIPYEQIALYVDLSVPTLRKLYKRELEKGSIIANAKVGEKLYQSCMEGNTTAQIFWLKTRVGWRETQKIDMTSSDGSMSPAPQAIKVVFVESDGNGRLKNG